MSRRADPSAVGDGEERISRRLGWVSALAGMLFAAGDAVPVYLGTPEFGPSFLLVGLGTVGLLGLLAGFGFALPLGVLRIGWIVVPALCFGLELMWVPAYRGHALDFAEPWVWTLHFAAALLFALAVPIPAALAGATLLGAAPALSGLLFTGAVPAGVAAQTPIQVSGSVAVVLILAGVRERLRDFYRAEAAAQESARREALLSAEAAQQRALARVVHDDVLAVLTAAVQLGGRIPPELRDEARTARTVLDATDPAACPDEPVDAPDAARALRRLIVGIDPDATVDLATTEGGVPRLVAEELARAAAEAVRNSTRHGGEGVQVHISGSFAPDQVRIVVRDDGVGFDPTRVNPQRMGLAGSILGRVGALDGGRAAVRSAPGEGTEVTLEWRR